MLEIPFTCHTPGSDLLYYYDKDRNICGVRHIETGFIIAEYTSPMRFTKDSYALYGKAIMAETFKQIISLN